MWNIIEPIRVMPLNDELEIAEAYVAEVEAELLESLTNKIEEVLDGIQNLSKCIIELDVLGCFCCRTEKLVACCLCCLLPLLLCTSVKPSIWFVPSADSAACVALLYCLCCYP